MNAFEALAGHRGLGGCWTCCGSREMAVGDVVRQMRMSPPAVSKHLRVLREAYQKSVRVDGQRRCYRVRHRRCRRSSAGWRLTASTGMSGWTRSNGDWTRWMSRWPSEGGRSHDGRTRDADEGRGSVTSFDRARSSSHTGEGLARADGEETNWRTGFPAVIEGAREAGAR